jgi:prepilin-type N-terminal cleavage/methylation domain-containing protein
MDRMTLKIENSDKGFTLLETMVALTILVFGMLAVTAMFYTAIGGNSQGGRMTDAVSLAQQTLEALKASPYADIASKKLASDRKIKVDGTPGGPYTRYWNVTTNTSLGLKKITVFVNWSARDRKHVVQLFTQRANDK